MEDEVNADNKNIVRGIRQQFASAIFFNREELYDYLEQNFFPGLKETTFRWRVYELKKWNIIVPVKRGLYKLSDNKIVYCPSLNSGIIKISRLLLRKYTDIRYCIWESNWLNEFSRHQAANKIMFIEVEKDLVKSIFTLLLDNSYKNVFIEPDRFVTQTYVLENPTSIIVKQLISKSPVQQNENVNVPKLEKILVDLFSDEKYLTAYKGNEEIVIFKNALDLYQINLSNLINYSRRRKRDKQIMRFLLEKLNIPKELMK